VQGATGRLFAAVHRDTPRGLRVRFEGTSYDEWIVGCADPEAVAAGLGLPAGAYTPRLVGRRSGVRSSSFGGITGQTVAGER
jgi:hypothetical protein